ncbi:uncharacterized protein LOC127252632 [Andrographis paniculata]|uniref:uncharacterized protein LOC127252632 n=1 Tax=Andrographis paniculata TaxID=175694 RepID=UPI0021E77971|nr:uncharacterized protein LOC127252632 [Andrographis paniculata]
MSHPSDSAAWKHFNTCHRNFAQDPHNVRLGLCTDGFAPFGTYGRNYSSWPIILTPYNLPPGMCMQKQYMFLTIVISGPNNSKRKLDVYLQPLVDELLDLWHNGYVIYDAHTSHQFHMHAALIWTIGDLPSYVMVSGWSTAGILGCPICMDDNPVFRLQYGKKVGYLGCHRQFLPRCHAFRRDVWSFIKGKVEKGTARGRLSGDLILQWVSRIPKVIDNPLSNSHNGYGESHKWTKKSILWDLSYWKDLLLQHNLDFPGQAGGREATRYLSDSEYRSTSLYILTKTPEAEPYFRFYCDWAKEHIGTSSTSIDHIIFEGYVDWFRDSTMNMNLDGVLPLLRAIASGMSYKVRTFKEYVINGWKFSTFDRSDGRASQRYGVAVQSNSNYGTSIEYFGVIEEILQVSYDLHYHMKVVLFRCR